MFAYWLRYTFVHTVSTRRVYGLGDTLRRVYHEKTTGILGGEHCASFLGVVCRTNELLLPDTASHSSHRLFLIS